MDVSLERRIEILEENMEQLRDVPLRLSAVESQIVQLRAEMQTGFSALRGQNDETRREMARLNDETRREMVSLNDETRREMVETFPYRPTRIVDSIADVVPLVDELSR